ncbi:hypothetical protein MNBD_GAMMA21-816 [hydrothermal vent metagenome]|uniref:Uncharacterized protein n=1 Tax=hydrothermal vent metagenome TaxID=652676 RepID=A0A3B1AFG4_9ZZZZ
MKMTLWIASLFSLAITAPVLGEVLNIPEVEAMPETIETEIPQPEAIDAEIDNGGEIPQPEMTDIESQPADVISITLPGKGMSKDSVEERFGSPAEKIEAVGEPPISRWLYGSFTVYFEYDHVIHAVNNK